jgi:hypothetical protein
MRICCDDFKGHFEFRHERGTLVFALPRVTTGSFYLGFRSVARSVIPRVHDVLKVHEDLGAVYLRGCVSLRFCPWCGVELQKFYRDTWRELIDDKITDEFRIFAV